MKKIGRYSLFTFLFLSCLMMVSNKVGASTGDVNNVWDEIGNFDVSTFGEGYFDKANEDDKYNYKFAYDYTISDTLGDNETYIYDASTAITYYYGISFKEANPKIDYVDIQGNIWSTIVDQVAIYKYNFVNYEFEEVFKAEKNSSGSYYIESPGIYKLETFISSSSGRAVYLIYEPSTVSLDFASENAVSVTKQDNAAKITVTLDVVDLDDRNTCRSGVSVNLNGSAHTIAQEKCWLTKVNSAGGTFVGNYEMIIEFSDSRLNNGIAQLMVEYNGKSVSMDISYDLKAPEKVELKYYNSELKLEDFYVSGNATSVVLPGAVDIFIKVDDESDINQIYVKKTGDDTIKTCEYSKNILPGNVVEHIGKCTLNSTEGLMGDIEFVVEDDYGNVLVIEQNVAFDEVLLPEGEKLEDYLLIEDNQVTLDFQGTDEYEIDRVCIFYGEGFSEGYQCGFPSVISTYYYNGIITIGVFDSAYNFETYFIEEVQFSNGYLKSDFTTTDVLGDDENQMGITMDVMGILDIACGEDETCKENSFVSVKYGDYVELLEEETTLPTYLDILNKKFKDSTCATTVCNKEVELIVNYKVGDINQSISRYYQYADQLPKIVGIATYPSNPSIELEYGNFNINSSDIKQALYADELQVNLIASDGNTYIGKISPVFVQYEDRSGSITILDNLGYDYIAMTNGFGYYTLECRVQILSDEGGQTYTDKYAKSFFVNVELKDTIPPVITLLGDLEVKVKQYGAYKDDGYKCNDLSGCQVTIEYFLNDDSNPVNAIDTKVAGKYIVKYNAIDGDGNHAVTVIRVVEVLNINTLDTTSIIAIAVIAVLFISIVTIGIIVEVKKNKKLKEREDYR